MENEDELLITFFDTSIWQPYINIIHDFVQKEMNDYNIQIEFVSMTGIKVKGKISKIVYFISSIRKILPNKVEFMISDMSFTYDLVIHIKTTDKDILNAFNYNLDV